MSENTLLSFFIFSKFTFLRFAEKLRGGWKKWPTSKNPPLPAGPNRLKKNPWMVHFTPISGKNPLFFTKFQKSISWPVDEILIPNWNCLNRTQSSVKEFFIYSLFWIFDSLRNQRCGTQFSLKKGFFQNFGALVIPLNWTPRSPYRKKLKKNNKTKMNFWPIFILFIYLFIFFSKKLFYFWKISKINYRFWRVVTTPIQMCEQIWAAISNGGPGGRLAPPASKCHKKNVGDGGSHHPATDCVDWAYLSVGGVRTNLTPRVGNHTKKTKVPTLPQKSQKTKVVGKNWKSRHRLFNLSATREK